MRKFLLSLMILNFVLTIVPAYSSEVKTNLVFSRDFKKSVLVFSPKIWPSSKDEAWVDIEGASLYLSASTKTAIAIFDFEKRSITKEAKAEILKKFLPRTPTFFKTIFHNLNIFQKAHADDQCFEAGVSSQLDDLSKISTFVNQSGPGLEMSDLPQILSKCSEDVFKDLIEELKLITNPVEWLSSTWESLKGVKDLILNIQTALPSMMSELSQMDPKEVAGLLCRVTSNLIIASFTGKLVADAVKLPKIILHEISYLRKLKLSRILGKLPKPKTVTLKITNGRAFEGTKEIQKLSLAKMTKHGDLLINNAPLEPMKSYTGIILKDGRMILKDRDLALHNQLVKNGDEVATAFELATNRAGKVMMLTNQSGTFRPDWEGFESWMTWWVKQQSKEVKQMPFRLMKYQD